MEPFDDCFFSSELGSTVTFSEAVDAADPGLFDEMAENLSISDTDSVSDCSSKIRRSYHRVSDCVKREPNYLSRRRRNNQSVKRCRNTARSRQESMQIKADGYNRLAQIYQQATAETTSSQMMLESLFRQHVSGQNVRASIMQVLSSQEGARNQLTTIVESIRAKFSEQLNGVTANDDGSSAGTSSSFSVTSQPTSTSAKNTVDGADRRHQVMDSLSIIETEEVLK